MQSGKEIKAINGGVESNQVIQGASRLGISLGKSPSQIALSVKSLKYVE
jgi:hypothetical protein